MLTKDGRDTPIERLTPENYIVPAGEERYYHVVIEVKQFDPKTGRRISKPRVQKFGKKSFDAGIRTSLQKQGYDLLILHDPTAWLRENREKAEMSKRLQIEANARAEQERFEKAVNDAVNARLEDAVQQAVAKALAERDKATKASGQGEAPEAGETAQKGRKMAKEQE